MKKCPFCAEEILGDAIKCKHCGSWLTEDQILDKKDKQRIIEETKQVTSINAEEEKKKEIKKYTVQLFFIFGSSPNRVGEIGRRIHLESFRDKGFMSWNGLKKWYGFSMAQYRRIWDTYRFPGFRPEQTVCGISANPRARVIQRGAYGLRDQEYLLLKVLTCMLPAL